MVATNRVSIVGAQSEPVPDVNGTRFVKKAAVPVRIVRDIDKAGILESVFEVLLIQCCQKGDRHRRTGDFASPEMGLDGGTEGEDERCELADV